ncbi:DNA cytosine methyltransferase [Salibacterium qingdaonense]|uniref:DNA (cytosine-5-)-methyltransferase n=1 Tax=Salibacterium qingdaonense TaxID=266892 RepID=A0A1I4LJS2_9BACI|nr:DNA cytosine methyltransferase [Salibacterium qingdaonense]SFL91189.1 DNA (cytosine-5)-methyltransferase 1 [Salibacterium qingdaonense]
MKLKKGELFCGPGGLGLAAKKAGPVIDDNGEEWSFEHVWANDYDKDSCDSYKRNISGDYKDPTVINSPVEDLPIGDRSILEDIDCFAFGFPCNDHSQVGERLGLNGEFGPLYTYGVSVLHHYKPKCFVAENVSGLRSSNEGRAFVKILSELEECGYQLTPHLYKFEEYGVPQARHRIIIVGIRDDLHNQGFQFKVPAPTTPYPKNQITSYKALTDPPIMEYTPNHEIPVHSDRVKGMLKHIPAGGNAWNSEIPEEYQLNVSKARMSSIYRKLRPDKPAYTVTGSGGGGTHMYHWDEDRALTNRERARLQTFPDDFIFSGGKQSVRRQIGMAVPPDGGCHVFEALLRSLAGIEYENVQPDPKLQLDYLKSKKLITMNEVE